jgi:hypothetical protein
MKMTIQEILNEIPIPPLKECGEILENKWFRLKSYYYILENAEKTENAEETLAMLNSKLIEIENCHSGVTAEKNPPLKYTGRMYPIQDDYIDRKEDGRIIALSKGNKIIIEPNGEFKILNRMDDSLILDKRYEN